MIKLTSFASGDFVGAQRILTASALRHGADTASCWGREDIVRTDFYRKHQALLDARRGAGYWIWKPFIILEELRSLKPGDVLIYSDTGRTAAPHRVDSPLGILIDWCVETTGGMMPGTYIPEWGKNRQWTKGECFDAMGCDSVFYRDHPQIQATFSVWQRHERSIAFVSEWLHWCTIPAAISDERVHPEIADAPDFIDHRHDQSILTLLALRDGLRCFGKPDQSTPVGKHLSSLVDRIAGRTWAMRRRIAREERQMRNEFSHGDGLVWTLRRTKRFAASWVKAVRSFP